MSNERFPNDPFPAGFLGDDADAASQQAGEPSWDQIFSGETRASMATSAAPLSRRELRDQETVAPVQSTFATVSGSDGRPPRRRRSLGWLWTLLVLLAVGGTAAAVVWINFEDQVREVLGIELPTDYEGTGNGEPATVVIAAGDIGADIAKSLEAAGVTLTASSFYDLLVEKYPDATFQPGSYGLEQQMSAQSALDALLDPENRVVSSVTIPEGSTLKQTLAILSKKTGIPLKEFKKSAKKYTAYGVPKAAPSIEGFLFPATYDFDPGVTATQVLQKLVDRMNESLDAAGVAKSDRLEVLTLASIIQKEGGNAKDFLKVSRVFTNRLDIDMALQSDATVSYGTGGTSILTTAAERADASNKYNTYANLGLPVGPISAPGDDAINAAMHPAKGDWLYFVLVNGETGETKFSTTFAEHEEGVAEFQAWYRAHPDWDN